MNHKLFREEYYNLDYKLNPQEEKEYVMTQAEPYWLTRSKAFLHDQSIFGTKSTIKQETEIFLFNLLTQSPEIILDPNDAKMKANLDFFERKFGKLENNKFSMLSSKYFYKVIGTNNKKGIQIFNIIPELIKMNRNLAYPEIYSAVSCLTDPFMVFANVFKKRAHENLIAGLIYFPFTPEILNNPNVSSEFISKFSNFLGLTCDYNFSFDSEKLKILKQKLLDVYYLVDDCEDLHGVTNCQSASTNCKNLASFFCENKMCKECCESNTNQNFCILHDDLLQFYRDRMHDLLKFEHGKNFDRSRTIRVSLRSRINKDQLRKLFKDETDVQYNIDWENIQISFRKGVDKIQFIYLTCNSNDEARRLYSDRGRIMKNSERLEINIQSLMEDISEVFSKVQDITKSGILVVPISAIISNNKKIPKKSQRNEKFSELIKNTLNIDESQYKLQNLINKINDEYSYDYYLIEFNEKDHLDKFYNSQPYLDSIIFHKISHLNFFPKMRKQVKDNYCVNCNVVLLKQNKCIFDLCEKCCVLQCETNLILSKINFKCKNCKNNQINNESSNTSNTNTLNLKCSKCSTSDLNLFDSECESKLCKFCCEVQILPLKECIIHKKTSKYVENYKLTTKEFNFESFIKNYQLDLSLVKLKHFTNLKNGEYDWFRRVEDTNLTRQLLDINKEIVLIMDNPNFRREGPLKVHDKMYKIFTYQEQIPVKKDYGFITENNINENLSTVEAFDLNGDFFVEYNFNNQEDSVFPDVFVPSSVEKLESYEIKNIQMDYDELNNYFNNSFHILMYGLDSEKYTNSDLIDEISQELKSSLGKFKKEDIVLIDEQSVLSKIIIYFRLFSKYY